MAIIVGNGIGNQSSNPERGSLRFTFLHVFLNKAKGEHKWLLSQIAWLTLHPTRTFYLYALKYQPTNQPFTL